MRSALRVVLPWIFAAMCCAVARVDSAQGTAAPGVTTCAVDALHKIPLNETCGTVPSSATLPAEPVVLHAMSGEAERMQILLTLPAGADSVVVTAGAAGFSPGGGVDVSVRYVGYVYCHTSTRYDGSGGGWRADPLMPIPSQGVALAAGANLALWVTARAAAGAAAGWRNGSVAVTNAVDGSTLATVPVSVEVWPVALPPLNATDSFATLFSFQYSGDTISRFYGGGALTTPMKHAWLDYLAALRFPGDALYLSEPRSVDDYEYFASQGVRWMNLLDVSSLPLDGDSAAAAVDASGGAAQGGGLRGACANYSDTYVANMIALLEPTVAALTARGLLDRAYVYGFDENPPSCEPQVRKLFGAVKAKWPSLRTVAVLNWPDMPPDLPLDVWVLSYTQYDAAAAAKWRAAGKQQFFYHCIVPSDSGHLNTFIERPGIEARLLYWLAFETQTPGWLYYAVDLYASFSPVVPWWSNYTTADGLTFPTQRQPVAPYGDGRDPRLISFDVANWIWAPRTDIFANGDGMFVYPGPEGPISSIRFELQSDGVEDVELFKQAEAAAPGRAVPLAKQAILNGTSWSSDPSTLHAARLAIAALLLQR